MNFIKSQEHSNYIRPNTQLHLENVLKKQHTMSTSFHFLNMQVLLQHSPSSSGHSVLNTAFKEGFHTPQKEKWYKIITGVQEKYTEAFICICLFQFPFLQTCHIQNIILQYYMNIMYFSNINLFCLVMSNSFANPWTVAHQPPLSMGFPRQEHQSELTFPYTGDLPDPEIEPASPPLAIVLYCYSIICIKCIFQVFILYIPQYFWNGRANWSKPGKNNDQQTDRPTRYIPIGRG